MLSLPYQIYHLWKWVINVCLIHPLLALFHHQSKIAPCNLSVCKRLCISSRELHLRGQKGYTCHQFQLLVNSFAFSEHFFALYLFHRSYIVYFLYPEAPLLCISFSFNFPQGTLIGLWQMITVCVVCFCYRMLLRRLFLTELFIRQLLWWPITFQQRNFSRLSFT